MFGNENNVNQLLSEIQTLDKAYRLVAKSTGEDFNIFSILNIESEENATHSRFLANLFNRNGSHNFKSKFLELFIDFFKIELTEFDFKNYQVITEYFIKPITEDFKEGGRIDILIKDSFGNTIMIENKIYAGEQNFQLIRYKNAFPKGKLFFLTLYGNKSTCKVANETKNLYESISYEKDILNWLDLCKKFAIDTPMLREVFNQYIYLVKKLTNQNINKQMSADITNKVLNDKSTFDAFKILVNSKNDIIKNILKDKVVPILRNIEVENKLTLHIVEDTFTELKQSWAGFSYSNEKLESLGIKITFSMNNAKSYKDFIFGFHPHSKDKDSDLKIQTLFQEYFGAYKQSQWLCIRNFENFGDWTNLDTLRRIYFDDFEESIKDKVMKMVQIADMI